MVGWLSGWNGPRLKLSLDSGVVDSTLTFFPVCIQLSTSCGKNTFDASPIFTELGSNSLKLAVTEDDGTSELKVEVVGWDSTAKTAELHTSVAAWEISAATDEVLYLYFDSAHADNTANVGVVGSSVGELVWDSNFVLVDHMEDNPNTSSTMDSTSNSNDGVKVAANQPLETSAKIGNGQQGDVVNDKITVAYAASLDNIKVTYSAWVKLTTASAANPHIIRSGSNFMIWGGAAAPYTLWMRVDGTGGQNNKQSGAVLNLATSYYCVATHNGTEMNVYINGAVQGAPQAEVSDLALAGDYTLLTDGGNYYDFLLDELRISSSARGDAWIKASYYNEDDNFITYDGFEYGYTGGSLYYYPEMWPHYRNKFPKKKEPQLPQPDPMKVDWTHKAVESEQLSRTAERVLRDAKKKI